MAKIVLLSGGMDSLISHRLFAPDHLPVFVNTGSRYSHIDIELARQQVPRLHVLEAPKLREHVSGVVPHRNIILLAMTANRMDAEEIVVSAPKGELIWDQQPMFYAAASTVLGINVANPLGRYTKAQAIAEWLRRGLSTEELLATRSCYDSQARQCGRCPACVKRWIALTNNGIQEHYDADVRQTAIELSKLGTWRSALSYGLRPLWEAYRAINQ